MESLECRQLLSVSPSSAPAPDDVETLFSAPAIIDEAPESTVIMNFSDADAAILPASGTKVTLTDGGTYTDSKGYTYTALADTTLSFSDSDAYVTITGDVSITSNSNKPSERTLHITADSSATYKSYKTTAVDSTCEVKLHYKSSYDISYYGKAKVTDGNGDTAQTKVSLLASTNSNVTFEAEINGDLLASVSSATVNIKKISGTLTSRNASITAEEVGTLIAESGKVEVQTVTNYIDFRGNGSSNVITAEKTADGRYHVTSSTNGKVQNELRYTEGKLTINGSDGNDTIRTSFGATINGGTGKDIIYGSNEADIIDGGIDNDIIFAGDGDDTINGGNDNDVLIGGDGADTINGGNANDLQLAGDYDGDESDFSSWTTGTYANLQMLLWNEEVKAKILEAKGEEGDKISYSNGDYDITIETSSDFKAEITLTEDSPVSTPNLLIVDSRTASSTSITLSDAIALGNTYDGPLTIGFSKDLFDEDGNLTIEITKKITNEQITIDGSQAYDPETSDPLEGFKVNFEIDKALPFTYKGNVFSSTSPLTTNHLPSQAASGPSPESVRARLNSPEPRLWTLRKTLPRKSLC